MSDSRADFLHRARPAAAILVASDAQANATMVSELLAREFGGVRASWVPESAAADFDESPPKVIVLAFEDLQTAELYYLGLFRQSRTIRSQPHRSIVLCHKDDVKRAFELCRTEHFDDYILFWPMSFDGYRLPMAVYNALRNLAGARAGARPQSAGTMPLETGSAQQKDVRPNFKAASIASEFHAADSSTSEQPPASPKKHRLLVVDDDSFQRDLYTKFLSAVPCEVMFAADSSEAFALAMADRPDLILMDIMLPGVDGLEATRRLRAHPDLKDVPVLILTGKSGRETVVESRRAGATDFLVKPVDRKVLIAKVLELLPPGGALHAR